MIRQLRYYLSSLPTLAGNVSNWYALAGLPFVRRPVTLRLRQGLNIRVRNLMDAWIVKEACLDRVYESCSVAVQDGWTVVDVGAGIGDFAVLTGFEHPASRVVAFEPFPGSFALLQDNIALNRVANVVALPIAISARSGRSTLATTGQAVQHTTTGSTVSGRATSTLDVQSLSLDDVFATQRIQRCHYLKMDCEGGEFEILLGAGRGTLDRIDHICLEYHDGFTRHTLAELTQHLAGNGFQVRTIPNPVHAYLGYLHAGRR